METFVNMLLGMLVMTVIFLVPLAAVSFFIVALVQFLKTDKEDAELREEHKVYLKMASCILGVIVLAFLVLMLLVLQALSHM